LLSISVVPPILYMIWFRNSERYEREPWGSVWKMFLWGGVAGVILALIFEVFVQSLFSESAFATVLGPALFMSVIVAPLVEEFTKPLGLRFVRSQINELEDGLIYGAAAGLGFAATENIVYVLHSVAEGGFSAGIMTGVVRAVSSTLLHGSATAITGYGLSMVIVGKKSFGKVIGCFLAAALMHGVFNLTLELQMRYEFSALFALILVTLFTISTAFFVRNRIKRLDKDTGEERVS